VIHTGDASFRQVLPHDPTGPSQARDVINHVLGGLPHRIVEIARLLVSELVTNAVQHTHPGPEGDIGLLVIVHDENVHVEVSDAGGSSRPAERPLGGDGGYGLRLVHDLSTSWGVRRTAGGQSVWFELAAEAPLPA
jgi:anti-sigma regulatory factor (Ser/Thr protein kinase)